MVLHKSKRIQKCNFLCRSLCGRIGPLPTPPEALNRAKLQHIDLASISPEELAQHLAMPISDEEHLYVYAIVDDSLEMHLSPGKLSAQTGHAYSDSIEAARLIDPERTAAYRDPARGGSKVSLKAKNAKQLIKAYAQALELGLPCALIVDQHHVLLPHFTGKPVITALGIGPCTKSECREITKKFRCI